MRVFVIAAVSLVVSAASTTPAVAAPDEWLEWGHDGGRSFANLGESVLTPETLAQGLGRSSVDVGLINVGQPLVRNGSVYTTSEAWDAMSGRLERFDISTGERVWLRELECFDPPVLSGRTILIQDTCGVSQPPPPKALSVTDGSFRYWALDWLGFVDRGVAYLTMGLGIDQSDYEVTAMDVSTGDLLWRVPAPASGIAGRPVLAAGNTLYVQRGDAIEAWDAATGEVRWSRVPTRDVVPLAAVPGALYVRWQQGDQEGIARWRTSSGHVEWRVRTRGSFTFTPTAIYQVVPSGLKARAADTGALMWNRTGSRYDGLGQPVFAAGVIWAMNERSMNAYDATDGEYLGDWVVAPAERFAVANGHVFVPSTDGRLFILSPLT